jgi:SAM-dependent methyltransferase
VHWACNQQLVDGTRLRYDLLMKDAAGEQVHRLLMALLGLEPRHVLRWTIHREADPGDYVGCVGVVVGLPDGEEVRVEIRDALPGATSWISEGGLDLIYHGTQIQSAKDGARDAALLAMGECFRAAMRRHGPELRARLAGVLQQARAEASLKERDRDEAESERKQGTSTHEVSPTQAPSALNMGLQHFADATATAANNDALTKVDRFVDSFMKAHAITSAFEIGLVDALIEGEALASEELHSRLGVTERGLHLLATLLVGYGVLASRDNRLRLTDEFRRALEHRGLLLTRLGLISLTAQELLETGSALFRDPLEFTARSRAIGLFDYRSADPERARSWVAITTEFTRYDAAACLRRHDFGRYRRVLDVGGNSGEFARQICASHPNVEVTVFDLPVVCSVGAQYLAGRPGGDRVSFVGGDVRKDPLPGGFELVCFKSMLHDWDTPNVRQFLGKAWEALLPGGRVLIYEREAVDLERSGFPFQLLSMVPYLTLLRKGPEYASFLEELGFRETEVERVENEMPFLLVTGRRCA